VLHRESPLVRPAKVAKMAKEMAIMELGAKVNNIFKDLVDADVLVREYHL
jgi:hypothetical protein